jgi:predicted RNase H-like HicB family nuclease
MPTTKALRRPKRSRHRLTFHVTIVVEPDGDEYFAYCPDLPGVLMAGATPQEARENARVAAQLCLETMIEYGDPIPLGSPAGRKARQPGKAADISLEDISVCPE